MLLRAGKESRKNGGIAIEPMETGQNSAKFDLVLSLSERDEGIDGEFIYSTALFDTATIRRLTRDFQTLLEGVVAEPGRRIKICQ